MMHALLATLKITGVVIVGWCLLSAVLGSIWAGLGLRRNTVRRNHRGNR